MVDIHPTMEIHRSQLYNSHIIYYYINSQDTIGSQMVYDMVQCSSITNSSIRKDFVHDNLLFYTNLLLQFLSRSFQLDFTCDADITLIFRVAKVINIVI